MVRRQTESSVSVGIRKTITALENGELPSNLPKPGEFTIKVANTLEERESVYRLAYQVYLEKGFVKENADQWLIHQYDADRETMILIVQDKNKNIVGSVSLVFDGTSRLPAQKIYSEEINLLRSAKEKIVEVSRLVINPDYRNSKEILVLLFNYLCIYTYHVKKYTCLAIEVNPRHKNYYKGLLSFDVIGGEKPCPIVENAPATLLYLPLSKYYSEVVRCKKKPPIDKKERSLFACFIKPELECFVIQYLKNQKLSMTDEEKLYFGFSDSGITGNICV